MAKDGRSYILHPFIIAIFPPLALFIRNHSALSIQVLFYPVGILLGLTFMVWSVVGRITGSYHKAGILLSLFWLWLFGYEPIHDFIFRLSDFVIYRHRYFIIIWILIGIIGSILVLRIKLHLKNITVVFNIMGMVLLLFAAVPLLTASQKKQAISQAPIIPHVQPAAYLPDIYYIILDAYGGQKGLKDFLGFDNSEFIGFLKNKGFRVIESSHSNYSWTRPSISSSLNMEYLPFDSTRSPKDGYLASDIDYDKLISQNRTIALAKSLGYKYYNLSIWQGLFIDSDYQIDFKPYGNDFMFALLHKTFLGKPLVENYFAAKAKRALIEKKFNTLADVPVRKKGATFVYAHFMVPHEPYVFKKDGAEFPLLKKMFQPDTKDLYIGQLQYTNKRVEAVLTVLLSNYDSLHLPIIIVQGDHGPRSDILSDADRGAQMRMSNLNAYFLPGDGKKELYDSITPVNSFRIVFRHYFGLNFPPLDDKSYFQARDDLGSPLKLMDLGK